MAYTSFVLDFQYPPLRFGGSAEATYWLFSALASRGHSVSIILPSYGLERDPFFKDMWNLEFHEELKNSIVYKGKSGPNNLFLLAGRYLSLKPSCSFALNPKIIEEYALCALEFLETKRFDFVHCVDYFSFLETLYVKKKLHKPLVYNSHFYFGASATCTDSSLKNKFPWLGESRNLELLGLKEADKVLVVSNCLRKDLISAYGKEFEDKIEVIKNGISLDFFDPSKVPPKKEILEKYGITPSEKIILYVGRFTEQKGADIVFGVARKLMEKFDATLVCAGYGNVSCSHLKNNKKFKVIPYYLLMEDIRELYAVSDIFLQPSRYEPFGLCPLEALAMGCVPIVTDVGGLPNSLGPYGLVIKPEADSLLRGLTDVLSNLQEYREKQKDVRRYLEKNFSWQESAKKLEELYSTF